MTPPLLSGFCRVCGHWWRSNSTEARQAQDHLLLCPSGDCTSRNTLVWRTCDPKRRWGATGPMTKRTLKPCPKLPWRLRKLGIKPYRDSRAARAAPVETNTSSAVHD